MMQTPFGISTYEVNVSWKALDSAFLIILDLILWMNRLIYIALRQKGKDFLSSMQESNNYKCTMVTFWDVCEAECTGPSNNIGGFIRRKGYTLFGSVMWMLDIFLDKIRFQLIRIYTYLTEYRKYVCKSHFVEHNKPQNISDLIHYSKIVTLWLCAVLKYQFYFIQIF